MARATARWPTVQASSGSARRPAADEARAARERPYAHVHAYIGRINAVEPIQDADHISLALVDIGQGRPELRVVFGGTATLEPGDLVPIAHPVRGSPAPVSARSTDQDADRAISGRALAGNALQPHGTGVGEGEYPRRAPAVRPSARHPGFLTLVTGERGRRAITARLCREHHRDRDGRPAQGLCSSRRRCILARRRS